MRSLYDFIVKPVGKEYDNEITIGNKKIILNTKIESFKFVNNMAEVVEIPVAFKTNIKKGDLLGWFNLGSTVILLLPPDTCELKSMIEGDKIFMGTAIGKLSTFKN